ncbi:MAG: twin-arginine translocase TatA/TatE family subunit [Methanocellales archaeon]|nr:twin-arginine translocase TatA/TatE family subunit [Methanocellales archaeon]MDD4897974.1 twin-arginine translocase TatA/TatE family subunit [Methanocellales archaeon]MDD5446778.1 twin-arginine translocase TatA/TatE family subunit [Methanocellales archaeon]
MAPIGTTEILVIFAVIVLLFGATKLPELAKSMGKSMGEFKKAQKEAELELKQFERSLESTTADEKKIKIKKTAKDLGIDTEGKTEDELLDAIQETLSKREEVN